MTLEWQPLERGAVDHERLWSSVLTASAVTAAAMLYSVGAPPLACVFKALTGFPCLTCGFTRGLVALSAGEVLAAARWNPLVPLGALAASGYVSYAVAAIAAGPRRLRVRCGPAGARAVRWAAAVTAAAVWAWLIVDGR